VWPRLNPFSRVPVCGVIHHYNATEVPMGENWGPRIFRDILTKRILVKGFIVWDYGEQQSQFVEEIVPLIKQGAIKVREDVSEGLESAPQSLIDVLQGANFGKKVIKVA
ncbi:MAG: NADP-dependent oxidoreductase, partial [Alphaproteobacteria bacterium]